MSAEIIERLYASFKSKDAAGMAACYHPEVTFSDPAFGELHGWKVAAMWHMLIERGTDMKMEYSKVVGSGDIGSANWEAWYTFQGKRPVHNVVEASFRIQDDRIISHTDDFDFWAWSKQALGPAGVLLGWTPMLKDKASQTANEGLDEWVKANNAGAELIPAL